MYFYKMRKGASVILLLVFIGAILSPIIPYLEYKLNKKYIAEVLCENRDVQETLCYGQCYLEKQLKKTNEAHQKKENRKRSIDTYVFKNRDDSIQKKFYLIPQSIKNNTSFLVCSMSNMDIPTPPPRTFL